MKPTQRSLHTTTPVMGLVCSTLVVLMVVVSGCTNTTPPNTGCTSDDECTNGERCLLRRCQPTMCEPDEIVCDQKCVNPRTELEFCGGCNGCPGTPNAESFQCEQGQCIYRCSNGSADANGDIHDPNGDGCECQTDGVETCDGQDNDCDGNIDEGLLNDCGQCGQTPPEVCDGQDNDCDGDIDADDSDLVTTACSLTEGVCAQSEQACEDGTTQACSPTQYAQHAQRVGQPFQAGTETLCDGADNNCNGQVDELCCANNDARSSAFDDTDDFFRLIGLTSNADATEFAILYREGSQVLSPLKLAVLDINAEPIRILDDLGNPELGAGVSLHQDQLADQWVVVHAQQERILVRRINDDGLVLDTQTITTGHTFLKIKTLQVGAEGFWLVGHDAQGAITTLNINGLTPGSQDTVLPQDRYEEVLSIDSVHYEAQQNRAWISAAVREQGAPQTQTKLLVLRSTTLDANPTFSQQPALIFDSTQTVPENTRAPAGSTIKGHDLYSVLQDGTSFGVVKRSLLQGPNAPTTVLFTQNNPSFTLHNVAVLENHVVVASTIGNGDHSVRVFDTRTESTSEVSLVDFDRFDFATVDITPHTHGALFITNAFTNRLNAELRASILNHQAKPLCP